MALIPLGMFVVPSIMRNLPNLICLGLKWLKKGTVMSFYFDISHVFTTEKELFLCAFYEKVLVLYGFRASLAAFVEDMRRRMSGYRN